MPRAAAAAAADDEKEICGVVIVLKVFIKLKFTLMKHLKQNEKICNNVKLHTHLTAYDKQVL